MRSVSPSLRVSLWGVLGIVVLAVDRYSYGQASGDAFLQAYEWQIVVAGCEVVLLIAVLMAYAGQRRMVSLVVLVTEVLLFVLSNIVFLVRDGLWRFVSGIEDRPVGLVVVLLGLVVRVQLFRGILTRRRGGLSHGA